MARVAVFDSGLGSLSVIRHIQRQTRCEIIYFADQRNFPYGQKTKSELRKIIDDTVSMLQRRFSPDIIVVGSNTPSIILEIGGAGIVAVKPPLKEAQRASRSKNIAVLATRATVRSRALSEYISRQKVSEAVRVHRIDCSGLVKLVESGEFLSSREKTERAIRSTLREAFESNRIDVATLSSTHLPFLTEQMERQFPGVEFLDPAQNVAMTIGRRIIPAKKNSIKIYSTDTTGTFEDSLRRLGVRNRVTLL